MAPLGVSVQKQEQEKVQEQGQGQGQGQEQEDGSDVSDSGSGADLDMDVNVDLDTPALVRSLSEQERAEEAMLQVKPVSRPVHDYLDFGGAVHCLPRSKHLNCRVPDTGPLRGAPGVPEPRQTGPRQGGS